jgi:hypothetical protein
MPLTFLTGQYCHNPTQNNNNNKNPLRLGGIIIGKKNAAAAATPIGALTNQP